MDGRAGDITWEEVEDTDDPSSNEGKSTDNSDLTESDLCNMALCLCVLID
jgi:hypothetical protein